MYFRIGQTALLLLDHYLSKQNYPAALEIAALLVGQKPEMTIFTGFESCTLVGYEVYHQIVSCKMDSTAKEKAIARLKTHCKSRYLLNLFTLAEIRTLVAGGRYEAALKQLHDLLAQHGEFLSLPITCDHDLDKRAYPTNFYKELYLTCARQRRTDALTFLRNAVAEWPSSERKVIAESLWAALR